MPTHDDRFGSWIVERPIGQGAMAVVYRCHHAEDRSRLAAVKVLDDAGPVERRRRFDREARLLRRLDHPGIVRVLEHRSGQIAWMALELVDGEPLERARPGVRRHEEVARLGFELADALAYLHRSGAWHRDIKPANVLIERSGRARLVDFGIAAVVDETRLTDEGLRAPGTVSYAPPEWFLLESPPFAAADAYALGQVLHEQLTGELAFPPHPDGAQVTGRAKLQTEVLDPGADVPVALRAVVTGLTRADPDTRLGIAEARRQLAAITASNPVEGSVPPALPRPGPLPEPADPFVGREGERTELEALLTGGTSLITLLGPSGTGKTRLALRTARGVGESLPGGAWFVELAEVRTADGLVEAVARALGVPLVQQDPRAQLALALQGLGRALIVLDNVEQLAEACREVLGPWLVRTEVQLLATSQERLRVAGERVLRLGPLPVPEPDDDLEAVAGSEAVRLFVRRARVFNPGFQLDAVSAPHVRTLVRALDGLPLAIELAASRVAAVSLEQLAQAMTQPLASLHGTSLGRAGRHATLRSALDWSWTLLTEPERAAVAQLSVFDGTLSLEAAEAVLELGDEDVLAVLQGLVDKSWLTLQRHFGGFAQLTVVRAWGASRLQRSGQRRRIEERHGAHFAALADVDMGTVVRLADPTIRNLELACSRALARQDVDVALRTALVLSRIAYRQGPVAPALERNPAVLELRGGDPEIRTELLLQHSQLLDRVLRRAEAQEVGGAAVEAALAFASPRLEGIARSMELARWTWLDVPVPQTLATLDAGLAKLREADNATALVWGLALRANLGHALRQPPETLRAWLDEAQRMLDRRPNPYLLTMVLGVRSLVDGVSLEPAIRLARTNGFRAMWLDAMCMSGIGAVTGGDAAEGYDRLRTAHAGAVRLGFEGRRADCASALAIGCLRLGRFDEAEGWLDEVVRLRREGVDDAHPTLCNLYGLVEAGRGRLDEARQWFDRWDARAGGLPLTIRVETLADRAWLLHELGREGPLADAAVAEARRLVDASTLDLDAPVLTRLQRAERR